MERKIQRIDNLVGLAGALAGLAFYAGILAAMLGPVAAALRELV